MTIGGVNGPICHGAGITHKTLSDYVRRIEYIDCHGQLRIVDDDVQIKAAAGAFGLLGVVTHITFELDAMSYAVMVLRTSSSDHAVTNVNQEPLKQDVGLGVPPLDKNDIPVRVSPCTLLQRINEANSTISQRTLNYIRALGSLAKRVVTRTRCR